VHAEMPQPLVGLTAPNPGQSAEAVTRPVPTHVFSYGSLMFDEVWSRVVRGRYARVRGRIRGYVRRCVRGASYPGLVPGSADKTLCGVVYRNVSPGDIGRLDEFEGEYYEQRFAECRGDDGTVFTVLVYVFKAKYRGLLEDREWDPTWFVREGMRAFLADYAGFSIVEKD